MNVEQATQVLALLSAQPWRYPVHLEEFTARAWIDYLRDVGYEDGLEAVRACGKTMESMPSYFEFRERCREAARERKRIAVVIGDAMEVPSPPEPVTSIEESRARLLDLRQQLASRTSGAHGA